MEHRVIVTADDFGACDFIDNGIREALKKGVVSSVSALINFDRFRRFGQAQIGKEFVAFSICFRP